MKKLAIIPAYNESESIKGTVEDIMDNAPDFDYIVINDCSTDNTARICEENNFNYISHPVNLGIGNTVQTGYIYAYRNGYDIAVQVDGDGQHDTKYLNEMAEHLINNNLDMVIGSRFINKEGFQSSVARRFGINYFTALIKLCTGRKITDPTSGLRMTGKRVIERFAKEYPKDYPEPETVLVILRNGYKVEEVPVIMRERQGGVSSISVKKSVYYMIKVTLAMLVDILRKKV